MSFFKELPLYLQLSKDSRFQTIPIQHSRTMELDFSQLFKCNLELQSITRVNPSPSTTQAEILRLMLNHNQPVRHVRNAFKNFSREHKEDDPNRVSWMYDNVQALVTASSEELALFADHSGFSISCRPATLPSLGAIFPF